MKYPKEVKDHMRWAKKHGFCKQCIHPWHDGMCSCGNFANHTWQMADIARRALEVHDKELEKQEIKNKKRRAKERGAKVKIVSSSEFQKKLNKTMKYDPVHNKNPNVTDAQRKARKKLHDIMTEGMTKKELEELDKDVQAMKKEMGWEK